MKGGFRQSMAWLHTWSGLLTGWVLLAVFATGTATYFQSEISLWMRPELHTMASAPVTQAEAATQAVKALQQRAPQAASWRIILPTQREPAATVMWRDPPSASGQASKASKNQGGFERALIDPRSGEAPAGLRATQGGETFYRFHYELHYLDRFWGRWIVGFCAMAMLVGIISGIVIHRRIFSDFFTFRPGKGQRSWLDAHNVSGVLALPFHLMITYSGLITLMFMYMPWGLQAAYPGKAPVFFNEASLGLPQGPRPAHTPAPLTAIAPLLHQASRQWDGAPADLIAVNAPNDAHATIVITRSPADRLSYDLQPVVFDGVTGALISSGQPPSSTAVQARNLVYGLHLARFAEPLLRALFFMSGLAGCAVVATGLLLWATKERPKHAAMSAHGLRTGLGLRLVDGFNIGAIAGIPVAMAAYFWANRLLPAATLGRADMEVDIFFMVWAAVTMLGLLRPTRGMWLVLWCSVSVLFAGLPLLNALTTSSHLGLTLLQGRGPAAVAGFDLTALALGCGAAGIVWKVYRRMRGPETARRALPRASAPGT